MDPNQIYSSLIVVIATIIFTPEGLNNFNIPNDLSLPHVVPIHYNVKLTPNIEMEDSNKLPFITNNYIDSFYGESSIIINILQSTRNITLHILNVDLTNWPELVKSDGLIYEQKNLTSKANFLGLYFRDILYPGLYNLKIKFFGQTTRDNAEGFFRTSHVNEDGDAVWVFTTHIQTIGARRLFPCWDDPQLRTTFAISIEHPRNSTALSNMPIRTQNTFNNTILTHFYTTPPISTYHVAIAVTNYNYIRINENISLWCRECSRKNTFGFVKRVIENVTSHLASEFERIKIPKVDHIAIPNFPQDSISKCGLIFYREADLIYDEQLDPVMRKIEVARCIAHKIASQWFGVAVSPTRWSSFWLHDGLATIFGDEAIVKTFNNFGIMDFFIVQNQYESLHLDSHFDMNPPRINNLSETKSLFSFPRYIKVPIVLRMLKDAITDEVFRRGVHICLYKYHIAAKLSKCCRNIHSWNDLCCMGMYNMFSSLAPYQFWTILEDLANMYLYYSLSEFSTWIDYRHYPIVTWTQENPSCGKMGQYFNQTHYGKWWISASVIIKSLLPNRFRMQVTSQNPFSYFEYDIRDDWVMVDIQQAGYYRVNYESKNWHKIAWYLSPLEYINISVINRAKIIDDAFHFTVARQLDISMFWDLTILLQIDTDYVAWYPMFKIFEYVSNVIPFYKHSTGIIVKRELSNLLDGPFNLLKSTFKLDPFIRFELSPENVFIKCLAQETAKWACLLGYGPCLAIAKEKLLLYLDDPITNVILPEWKEWIYCKGLLKANISVWNLVKNRWLKNDSNHKLLPYLACTRDHSIIVEHLPYVKWNPSTYETQDTAIIRSYINIFHSIVAKHANNYFSLMNILLNLKKIKPKEISTIVALTDIINHVYSEMHLIGMRRYAIK